MRLARPLVLLSLAAGAAFVACTLNPQPLPPGDDERSSATGGADASFRSDAAAGPELPPPQTAADASVGANDGEGGSDDGGDAGDGGDAADGS